MHSICTCTPALHACVTRLHDALLLLMPALACAWCIPALDPPRACKHISVHTMCRGGFIVKLGHSQRPVHSHAAPAAGSGIRAKLGVLSWPDHGQLLQPLQGVQGIYVAGSSKYLCGLLAHLAVSSKTNCLWSLSKARSSLPHHLTPAWSF